MSAAEEEASVMPLPEMTIRQARPVDLAEVLAVLNAAAAALHRRGLDQWPEGFGPDRIGPPVDGGYTWLADAPGAGLAVATITLSPVPDVFWREGELAVPALYVTKMATAPQAAGRGYGAAMLRWAVDRTAREGIPLVRLDVWRTNLALQDWYRAQGFEHVRTEVVPGRYSGALFARPAVPDLEARQLGEDQVRRAA